MKKRILSLILALSMVLSVLPLGAFAADPPELVMGANGLPVYSEGTVGHNWVYMNGTLCLLYGTFDFSSTHPQNTSAGTQTARPVACPIEIESDAEITGGIFEKAVTNNGGTIYDGTFNTMVENNVVSWGTLGKIVGGAFNGTVTNKGTISGGAFACSVENNGLISDGTFKGGVINYKTISGGTFQNTYSVENHGTISDGTFEGIVANNNTISGGTFQSTSNVTNDGTIKGNGIFAGIVTNNRFISGGTFQSTSNVTNANDGTISDGTFAGRVINNSLISGGAFQNGCSVTNYGTIKGNGTFNGEVSNNAATATIENGTFNGKVSNNQGGKITNGTFEQEVINNAGGEISGGIFKRTVLNGNGIITGGTFAAGLSGDEGSVTGGVFNGKTGLTTKAHQVTVTNGSVSQVNGVDPRNADGTTGTAWDLYAYKGTTVIITADTEIFSLNGHPISGAYNSSYPYTNNKKIVKFTMPYNENVVLSTGELVMAGGYPIGSNNGANNYNGKGWAYSAGNLSDPTDTGTLHLWSGTFDFNFADPTTKITRTDSAVACEIQSYATIIGGIFAGSVKNGYTIENGTFTNKVENSGYINNGTFNGTVTNEGANATIENGIFDGGVTNGGTIKNGIFDGTVTNNNTISGGFFEGTVTNDVTGYITGGTFQSTCSVTNTGIIKDGIFTIKVENGGIGEIFGGIFAAGLSKKSGNVAGGVFNGNATITGVRGLHSITWDTAYPNAKITKVNDVSADWKPYVVIDGDALPEVIITADTEIFSLNGKSIGDGNCNSSYGSDRTTVTFTMPDDKDVVLNGAIASGDLVMEKGWPKDSYEGKISCSGTDWSYDHNTGTLTLTSGTYDFSFTYPQNAKGAGAEPVKCAIESYATISGGIFDKAVTNDTEGMISGNGTFKGEVKNHNGTISGGKFEGTVINDVNGTISDGTFNKEVSNINGNISNGTFNETVTNDAGGTIYGGTFAGGVNNKNDRIYGGVFNGNATLTNVTGLHSITVASGAKIKEVNDVSAVWDPYVVVTESTKNQVVTITADTEIFSLNGKPIVASNCNSSYGSDKKTVTFTMPDDDVVLNKAITSTDLVMENGWPKDSNGGKNPCKGDGWEYIPNDPTYGNMLLLTGSNQTGGLFDFSTIGDGAAVECNVFVGKPTAITGGEFNGKVFNNSGILGGTFHGEVDNMGPGRIVNGTFHGAVENKGMIENGAFHDAVENNGTINDGAFNGKVKNNSVINSGTFNGAVENNGTINGGVFNGAVTGSGTVSESITGSGTLNGEPITKTEPEPEPEPTTYTVTVIGGTIDGKTSVSAKENDTLTVVLDQNDIPDGMTFDMWSISSSKLSGDINVDYRAEAMTFQMPAEDVTIRAQYRSAEIIEDAAPSPLATAATIAVGGAAAGIVVWQGVSLGVDLYLANALPQGVPVPTDRRALALLLWETAGKPEVALPTLYGDIPAEEIELQKATRWAVQNGLMDAADKKDASFFDPDHYVTKMDVFGAWLRLKKLLGTT